MARRYTKVQEVADIVFMREAAQSEESRAAGHIPVTSRPFTSIPIC